MNGICGNSTGQPKTNNSLITRIASKFLAATVRMRSVPAIVVGATVQCGSTSADILLFILLAPAKDWNGDCPVLCETVGWLTLVQADKSRALEQN